MFFSAFPHDCGFHNNSITNRTFEDILQGKPVIIKSELDNALNTSRTPVFDKVFGFMGTKHWIRKAATSIIEYVPPENPISNKPLFDWFIIVVIFVSTGFLAAESPIDHVTNSPWVPIYRILDYVFIGIFSVEAILRIISTGVILTPNPYFKSVWNIIDLIILGSMCLDTFYFQPRVEASQGIGRFFRAIRAIRPIRLVNQFDGFFLSFLFLFLFSCFLKSSSSSSSSSFFSFLASKSYFMWPSKAGGMSFGL
jgi:hypothetical protein